MKTKIKALLAFAVLSVSASGVTINMDRGTTLGMVMTNADGTTRVAQGSLIRFGTMNGAASTENFVQFATSTVEMVGTTGATATVPGSIRLPVDILGTTPAIAGQQIYMWVYAGPTASPTANQGLFTSTGWVVPSNFASDALASYNLTLGQNLGSATPAAPTITTVNIAGLADQASTRIGSIQNTPTGAINTGGVIYELGLAIPEPSTALLGLLGVIGLVRRRR